MGNALVPQETSEISSWMDWDGFTIDDFPRLREVTVDDDEFKIVVRTRTGGGNREEYEKENKRLTRLNGYIEDEDDSFDSTYAYFEYKIPERSHARCKAYVQRREQLLEEKMKE